MKAMSFPLCRRICRQPKKLGLASRRAIRMPDAIHPIRALGWFGKDLTVLPGCRRRSRSPLRRKICRQPKKLGLASRRAIRMPDAIHPISTSGWFGSSASGKPSIGRRAFRSVAHFFITALIAVLIGVAASSAWQSYGDDAKEMVRTWAPSLDRLSSAWQSRSDEAKRMIKTWALSLDGLMKKSPPDVDIAAKQKGSSPAAAITQKPVPAAVAVPFELVQQLKTMAHDLTVMRQRVEQLAVKQEQMAHNIASLQAVEQDIKQKMRSPLLPPAASLPPRKNAPRVAPPQPPARVSILADWSIRDARDGYVTVQGHGDAYRVVPGTPLPGLGPVEQIKRQDGHWVVVTPKGIIVPRRGPRSDDEDDVFDGARVNRDDDAD